MLLSPLLSAQSKSSGGKPTRTADSTRDRAWEAARQHELLFGPGQGRIDAGLIFCQAGAPSRVGQPFTSSLRVTLGPFPVLGKHSLIEGVSIPYCLPESPDEVLKLISRDLDPDPSLWVPSHLALSPAKTQPVTELCVPGVLGRAVLPQARPAAAYGDLHFDKCLAGLIDGADPGDRAGIVA
jgi:hypothetical protein